MEIISAASGSPPLTPVLQDYRQRYALSETVVLDVLMEALSTRQAQAWVAVQEGRPVGAVVLSRRADEGRIHLLHALPEAPAAASALLERAAEELARGGGLACITASLSLLPGEPLEETFRRQGYQAIVRARMVLALASFAAEAAPPAGYRLTAWQEQCAEEAAALVAAAHSSAEDIALYPEVASVAGARGLLEQVQAGKFGPFDPALAPMMLSGEVLAGLCLTAWHAALPGQGFILDLAVDTAHRQRGLGRALVVATAQGFRQAGAAALSLAVTTANRPAWQLYEGLGFRVEQYFGVFQKTIQLS